MPKVELITRKKKFSMFEFLQFNNIIKSVTLKTKIKY